MKFVLSLVDLIEENVRWEIQVFSNVMLHCWMNSSQYLEVLQYLCID